MTKKIIISLHLYFSIFLINAQAPIIQWQNTIGGSDSDWSTAVSQTTDGGYILGGLSRSNTSGDKTENSQGNYDYWLVKLDNIGNITWQKTIGGISYDGMTYISQTTDGGYILGGHSNSNISGDKTENSQGDYDYWVIKLDSIGNIVWQNTIGGSSWDQLYSLSQTSDGGYILGGASSSNISGDKTENSIGDLDYWVIKLDSIGNIAWQKTIGGSLSDELRSISQTADGGYILGGFSWSNISGDKTENSLGAYDYWVVKLDSYGNIIWQNTIGGSFYDRLSSISQTTDGGYIIGGHSFSSISGDKTENSMGDYDYWVIKLASTGAIEWQNTIGGSAKEELYSILQSNDGGYVLGGRSLSDISGDKTENSLGGWDYWLVKLDIAGDLTWQSTIGGSSHEELSSIKQTTDGSFVLGGSSSSNISGDKNENSQGGWDYWVVKLISVSIQGCTDTTACNYNPAADSDDGSCMYAVDCLGICGGSATEGCTNIEACNYDSTAECNDGTCILIGSSCDDGNPCSQNDIIDADCMCSGEPLCIGDSNLDCIIDTTDLLTFLAVYGCNFPCEYGDFNGDTQVNTADLLLLLSWFGSPCT